MENTEFQQAPIIPETPIISEPSFNPVEPLSKPKNNRILITIIVILLLAVLYLLYLNFNKPSTITSTSTPTTGVIPTETAVPTTDPTADWKTYMNTSYSYSVKYPSDLKITENIQPNFTQISVGNIVYIKAQKNYPINQPNYYLDFESTGERNIGNISWKTFYLKDGYSDGGIISKIPIYALQIEKNKILYSISGFTSSDLTTQQLQILSTFKFTDNAAVIPSSITTFYTAVNSYFKSNIDIVPEKQFYTSQGMVDKASWSLDITKVNKEKGLVSNVFINQFNMKIGPGGGDRGGASIIEFINDKLDCYYSTGYNSTGGPETWNDSNSYSNILCTEK